MRGEVMTGCNVDDDVLAAVPAAACGEMATGDVMTGGDPDDDETLAEVVVVTTATRGEVTTVSDDDMEVLVAAAAVTTGEATKAGWCVGIFRASWGIRSEPRRVPLVPNETISRHAPPGRVP